VYNLNGDVNVGLPARYLKGSFRVGSSLGYYKGTQFINGLANAIHTFSAGPTVGIDVNPMEKVDLSLMAAIDYNKTKYSLEPELNTNYFSQLYEAEFNWHSKGNILQYRLQLFDQ
jgi:hypothetical protein